MRKMTLDQTRLDANESAYFNRQLETIKAKTYDTKLKNLKALTIIPVNTSGSNGVDVITWRSFTQVGRAKMIGDYATDFPRVDVYGVEQSVKTKGIGDSYAYSIKDIRRSQQAGGTPLDQRRAMAARRAIDEQIDQIALFGHAATGLKGLLNYTGITSYTVANGASTFKTWATKTPQEILKDVKGMVDAVMVPTKGREVPDTLLLPLAQYNLIADMQMGTVNDTTVMAYILKNNPYIKRIEWLNELTGAGAGVTDRMMVGTFDEEHITFEMPQPFEQFTPQPEGMAFKVPCHAEVGGCIIYYTQAFATGDGI